MNKYFISNNTILPKSHIDILTNHLYYKKVFLFVDVILIVVVNATPTCIQAMSKDMSSMMGSNGILPPLFFLALSILQLVSIVTENELPMMVCTIYNDYDNIIQLKIRLRNFVAKKP